MFLRSKSVKISFKIFKSIFFAIGFRSILATIMKSVSLLLVVTYVVRSTICEKILGIFPLSFKSHFVCTNAVMSSLSKAGHEVTVITPFLEEAASRNYSRIIDTSQETRIFSGQFRYNDHRKVSTSSIMQVLLEVEIPFCSQLFRNKEYQDLLASTDVKFDVVFVEMHAFHNCFLPIAQKLKVPVIGVTTYKAWYLSDQAIGNVIHPADVPYDFITAWKFNWLYDRLINTWRYIEAEYYRHVYIQPALKQFYLENEEQLKPYDGFLDLKPSLIFYNSHHTILPRPMNPNVIEIGGLQITPAKALSENILKFIEDAEHGVILFSFGSMIKTSTLPTSTVTAFVNVFASIPQRVIWKYEDEIENVPKNVMLMKWVPQRDILEHPNVKAFISHCGQSGVYETIYTATPVIAYPLRIDQFANAAILENLGVAVELDIDLVTEEDFSRAINLIINDTKYYENMQKLSKAFKDRPMTPEQSVVYWTEYIIRQNGAPNLRPPSSQLNFFQYFMLDVVCVVTVVLTSIVYSSYWCFRNLFKFFKIVRSCKSKSD